MFMNTNHINDKLLYSSQDTWISVLIWSTVSGDTAEYISGIVFHVISWETIFYKNQQDKKYPYNTYTNIVNVTIIVTLYQWITRSALYRITYVYSSKSRYKHCASRCVHTSLSE